MGTRLMAFNLCTLELRSPSGDTSEGGRWVEAKGPTVPVYLGWKGLLFVNWAPLMRLL